MSKIPVHLKTIIRLGAWPYIVFLLNYSLYKLWLEQYIAWKLDMFMHILGGVAIAHTISYLLELAEDKNLIVFKNWLVRTSVIVAFVIVAAVFWEWYEFLSDVFFVTVHQSSLADTMKDLFMGLLGGVLYIIFLPKKNLYEKL